MHITYVHVSKEDITIRKKRTSVLMSAQGGLSMLVSGPRRAFNACKRPMRGFQLNLTAICDGSVRGICFLLTWRLASLRMACVRGRDAPWGSFDSLARRRSHRAKWPVRGLLI